MRWALVIGSTAVHGGFLLGLGSIQTPSAHEATAISVFESPPPPAEPPPPPPVVDPSPPLREARAPRRPAAPSAAPEPATAPLDALPDLGLELSGVAGEGGGLAVRAGSGPVRPVAPAVSKRSLVAPTQAAPDPCQEGPAKPKLISLPKPSYTAQARQNQVEGKVRVRIQVDAAGQVVGASILESLGFGLDEAALEAAKSARFEAAIRCGKGVASSVTVAMRFSAG